MSTTPMRLWIQPTPAPVVAAQEGREAIGTTILATAISSGVGTIIAAAADRLTTDAQYDISGTLAYEPAFAMQAAPAKPLYLLKSITLNVGPSPVKFAGEGQRIAIDTGNAYAASPVVIRVDFESSADGTALAARVVHWKYQRCLGDKARIHGDGRRITVDIKVRDAAGTSLVATAMQVSGRRSEIGRLKPQEGERLPWSRAPSPNAPADLAPGDRFGPVNIEVRITEVASPSWLGRLLGATLSSQKAAVETYVKDRVTQAFDASAAAQSALALMSAAQAAWGHYAAAHKEAVTAREAYDKARGAAEQVVLATKRAIVAEKETLAREAYAKAGLAFQPLAPIPAP